MKESYTYHWRTPLPWYRKINPLWLASNPDEPKPPADYKPTWPAWARSLAWWVRNPFQGAGNYGFGYSFAWGLAAMGALVVALHLSPLWLLLSLLTIGGVSDRNYTVTGPHPVLEPTADNNPALYGWRIFVIRWHGLPLPMVAFENGRCILYAGWQPTGFFGFKINGKGAGIV
jgi:hypothetical protein